MIRLLRNRYCDSSACWHSTEGQSAGYGFNGHSILRTKGFEPDMIVTDINTCGYDQYADARRCRLIPKEHGEGFELVTCSAKRDERIMLITDHFDMNGPNVEIVTEEAELIYHSFSKSTRSTGRVDKWGRSIIRFNCSDSYMLVKVLPSGYTSPYGRVYSWQFGCFNISPNNVAEFEANPIAYFEQNVTESRCFEAVLARYRERKALAKRFRQIIAKYSFASLPIDGIFTIGAGAVSISFGGKTFLFYYDKEALGPFRECVELIDDFYNKSYAPIFYYTGKLCQEVVSKSNYCRALK